VNVPLGKLSVQAVNGRKLEFHASRVMHGNVVYVRLYMKSMYNTWTSAVSWVDYDDTSTTTSTLYLASAYTAEELIGELDKFFGEQTAKLDLASYKLSRSAAIKLSTWLADVLLEHGA